MFLPCVFLLISCAGAAIVPEELPSLLSVAYANIPPIKKGTDSRVGFGFSLGNHADFQVVFELGPQVDTNPIGTAYPTNTKRQAPNKVQKVSESRVKLSPTTDGSKYLSNWSQNLKQKTTRKPFQPLPIPGESADSSPLGTVNLHQIIATMGTPEGIIDQPVPSNMPKVAVTQLKQLYGGKVEPEPPRFVPKRNGNIKVNNENVRPANVPSHVRLAQFDIDEERESLRPFTKRKITEELSDVSLDDD